MKLCFDDFISEFRAINNGIGQGHPLSMIIYILYNADLLEIPADDDKDAIGYVDDAILMAIRDSFTETVATLADMMEREDGGFQWTDNHNSKFEISKVAVMHLSQASTSNKEGIKVKLHEMAPPLILRGTTIEAVKKYKYLRVLVDPELRWKAQTMRAVEKATKWVMLFKRLTEPSTGVRLKLMRQLYLLVGIPKLTYALDVWYTPPYKQLGKERNSGSIAALRQLTKIQQMVTIAIIGAL